MSGAEAIAGRPARRAGATGDPLLEAARAAAGAAQEHLYRIRRGEHWVAELESNVTITAEYVFLRQALGLDLAPRRDGIVRYLSAHQRSDGSWGIGHGLRGDVSTTAESYLALRLLGVPEDDPRLRRAEAFIRGEGGLAKVRVFTRIHLALFGLFPWDAVPAVPPEVIYLPAWSPVNIYRLASWARSTMVPLFLVFHHRPVFALPNGRSETNGWLDHLWLNPADKHVAYREPVWDTLRRHGAGWKALFNASDVLLRAHDRARGAAPLASLRKRAVAACERWVLDHEETSGDWGGIFPPMFNGVLSLRLQGYALDSGPVRRGLEAIERFSIDDAEGFRIEA